MEYTYAFFEHAPEQVVYDKSKELESASSLREPSFFGRARYYQDQMHHSNHSTAPKHYNSKEKESTNGPISEQFNATVRCRQNSMMFNTQVGYVTLICAQALYWNAKKRLRLQQPYSTLNILVYSTSCRLYHVQVSSIAQPMHRVPNVFFFSLLVPRLFSSFFPLHHGEGFLSTPSST